MTKRILLPLDRGGHHDELLAFVSAAARAAGATVRLLHVARAPGNVVDAQGRLVAYVDQEMARLTAEWLDTLLPFEPVLTGLPVERKLRFGDPVDEILADAEEFGADLIVVGTAGRSAVKRVLLGSVAEQIFRRARPTVLLCRPAVE